MRCSVIFRLGLLLPVSIALSGCFVVPIKMRTLQQNALGERILVPAADVAPGTTTWQDLQAKYKDMAVDSGDPDLFFAQYRTSGWAVVYGVGGLGAAEVGGDRLWRELDILATLDHEGLVKTFEQIPEQQLGARLTEMQRGGLLSELNFTTPIRLTGKKPFSPEIGIRVDLAASQMSIELDRPVKKKRPPPSPMTATLTGPEVAKLKLESATDWTADNFSTRPFTVEMKFAGATPVGKKLRVDLEPREAFALVRWLAQQGSPPSASTTLKR